MIEEGLSFESEGHVYRMNGVVVPGVTRVLEVLRDYHGIKPETLKNKAELGDLVHAATALHASDELDEASVDREIWGYMNAWRKFREEVRPKFLSTEELVYHFGLGFAGTLDHRVIINDQHGVLDKKISPPDATDGVQLSAYLAAWLNQQARAGGLMAGMQRMKLWALHLKANGTYKLVPYDDVFHIFVACLTVYRFKNGGKNGRV